MGKYRFAASNVYELEKALVALEAEAQATTGDTGVQGDTGIQGDTGVAP